MSIECLYLIPQKRETAIKCTDMHRIQHSHVPHMDLGAPPCGLGELLTVSSQPGVRYIFFSLSDSLSRPLVGVVCLIWTLSRENATFHDVGTKFQCHCLYKTFSALHLQLSISLVSGKVRKAAGV